MKRLITLFLLVLFTAFTHAQETMCFTNEVGATTHIFKGEKLKIAVNITKEGTYTLGTWTIMGKTMVNVEWYLPETSTGVTKRLYPINTFKRCEL